MGAGKDRLLVVDDNSMNLDVLSRHLVRQGYQVETATDGLEAMAALKHQDIALMLLDIHMPKMDGIQVLEATRKDSKLMEIPVIVISSDREIETVARCIELGAEDYLPKPFNSTVLKARVGRCLEKRRFREVEKRQMTQIQEEKEHVERLLNSLFPRFAVEELKATNRIRPMRFERVAILFSDLVNYTRYSEGHRPEDVLADLHQLFVSLEEITDAYGIEKISAMGDEYMAVAGLDGGTAKAVLSCVEAGQRMIEVARTLPTKFDMRIGVNVGDVVGGIVGQRRFHYSVWGDAVNVASRMQSNGIIGAVNLSRAAWECLDAPLGTSRGMVDIKGKGAMEMFTVEV
jgi:CheY-like chemotaxis protein